MERYKRCSDDIYEAIPYNCSCEHQNNYSTCRAHNETISGARVCYRHVPHIPSHPVSYAYLASLYLLFVFLSLLSLSFLVDSFENKTNKRKGPLIEYNIGRQVTDLSDQLSTYYKFLRRSIKWYQKVVFQLIVGTAVVHSYLIYKENYATSNITILKSRKTLVRSLLLGVPTENLKPGPRQQSTSSLKGKLTDHKLEELEGSARNVRKRCVGWYGKLRQQQSREASAPAAERLKTFCPGCDKLLS